MRKVLLFLLLALLPVYLTAQGVEGDDCESALDLASLTAPYHGSTLTASNDFSLCSMGNSNDLIFYYDLAVGEALEIQQVSNDFDSRHSMRWGGVCPGANLIDCIDDPDTKPIFWSNETEEVQRVWFILGGYGSASGSFVLDWTIHPEGYCPSPNFIDIFNTTSTSTSVYWSGLVAGSSWEVFYGPQGFDVETEGHNFTTASQLSSLSDLLPGTNYDLYVRTICGTDVYSDLYGPATFLTLPFCLPPSSISLTNVDLSSAMVSWNDAGNVTLWELEYGIKGFIPGNGTRISELTTPSTTLSGLAHSTTYDVYVRAICSNDDLSTWSSKFSFSTLCSSIQVPYMEAFINPDFTCWSEVSSSSGQSGYSVDSRQKLNLYGRNSTYILSMPQINVNLNDLLLEFKASFITEGHNLMVFEVGVMEDPKNMDSFISQFLLTGSDLGSGERDHGVLLSNVPDSHRFIGFRLQSAGSLVYVTAIIDDLSLTVAPDCIRPASLRRTSATLTSFSVDWSENGGSENWELVYGLEGFNPDYEGTLVALGEIGYEISGLVSGTNYEVYVRSVCDVDLTSDWSNPVIIRTLIEGDDCSNAIDLGGLTAPYQGSTLLASNDFDLCYMGSSRDLIFFHDVEPGAEIEIWQSSNGFDSRHTMRWGGACPGENIVECVDDPDTKPLLWFNTTSETQRVWFVLGGFGTGAGSFLLDWHYKAPDYCFEPVHIVLSEITAETAMVNWTSKPNSTEWELGYGLWGFDLETQGERMVVTEPSAQLNGLNHTSEYQVYIRSLCGEQAVSEWVSTTFLTACVSVSIPYQPDLSNVNALHCWNFLSPSWNGSHTVNSSRINYNVINTTIFHVMPLVDEPLAGLSVRFNASTGNFTNAGGEKLIEIGTLSNPANMATFVAAESFALSELSANKTSYGAVLQNVPEGHTYIGWRLVNGENNNLTFHVSDVVVDYADVCVAPVELQAEFIAARYATFTWRELGTSESWDLVIGTAGFDPDESGVMLEAEENELMVEGLTPSTIYDVYVRSKCDEVSSWSGPLKITTPVACAAPFNVAAESVSETSILLNWDSPLGVNDWEVEYYEFGNATELAVTVSVSGEQSLLVENLKPNTYFTFKIRSSCGDEDGFSSWSGNVSAAGLCQGLAAIPYENDFDGVPFGMMPICWESMLQAGTYGYINPSQYSFDNRVLRLDTDGHFLALLPDLDAELQDLRIGFKAMNLSWSEYPLILEVIVLTEGNMVEVIQSIDMEYTSTRIWSEYVVYLENYTGNAGRLGLRLSSVGLYTYPNLYLDELIVDYIPACPEPYGMVIENLTQTEAHISWNQYASGESLAILWGPEGFDIETEGQLLTLDSGVTEHFFSSMEPSTAYEVYVRNNCSAENQSVWTRPLKIVTPCWPLEVVLLNIAENEVVNPADGLTLNLSYQFDCPTSLFIGLENINTGISSWLTMRELTATEGEVEVDLPLTIPSGNYRVVVFYMNYNNTGIFTEVTAYSHVFVIQNNNQLLEISNPSERTVFIFRADYSNHLWLNWNSVGVASVNIDYSLDNGTTWENWVSKLNSSNGYSPYGNNSYRVSITNEWVGESMLFRIASFTNSEVFAVFPEVIVLDRHPFTLISPLVQTEVPHGTNFDIDFDMSISDLVSYYVFDIVGGQSVASAEVEVIEGENLISVPTDDLVIGRSYLIEIFGSGWSFWNVSPFTVTPSTSLETNAMDGTNVVIYPVPTNSMLHIEAKDLPLNTKAALFDLSGRKLIESYVNGTPLNLSHLASGVYLLIIDGQSYKVVKK